MANKAKIEWGNISSNPDEITDRIDEVLVHLELAKGKTVRRLARGARGRKQVGPHPLKSWRGIQVPEACPLGEEESAIPLTGDLRVLDTPLNLVLASHLSDTGDLSSYTGIYLMRYTQLSHFQVRQDLVSILSKNGKVCRDGSVDIHFDGTKWKIPQSPGPGAPNVAKLNGKGEGGFDLNLRMQAMIGIAFVIPMFWHVELAFSQLAPSIRVRTSAEGVLDLLRNRDKPILGRRPALLHWVRDHVRTRTTETGEQVLSKVREHIRGGLQCQWRGMHVHIHPSKSDLTRLSPDLSEKWQQRGGS